MSVNESTESSDAVYQTPGSIVLEEQSTHEELEPSREEDLGASPELDGPVTRSGRKRKNTAPVKSSGKKKNKTMTSRTPPRPDAQANPPTSSRQMPGATPPPDLAALLSNGLSSIQSTMVAMEEKLVGKMDSLEACVNVNKRSISILTGTVSKNTVDLARLETPMREGDDRFEDRVAGIVRSVMGRDSHSVSSLDLSSRVPSTEQIERYASCRRSLRLWPIVGQNIEESVKDFLRTNLGYTRDQVEDLGRITARRVIEPRSKIDSEAVVEFASSSIRDAIKSLGFKLEGKRAGIRIEIPNFLKSDFHVLQNLSYRLKQANKDMKRSVKFDDDTYGLMLDIQFPGQEWRRIRPDQARAARSVDPSLQTGPRELSIDMIAGAIRGDTDRSGDSTASGSNAVPLGARQNSS